MKLPYLIRGLRGRLLGIVLLGIVPVFLLSLYLGESERQDLIGMTRASVGNLARESAANGRVMFESARHALSFLAEQPALAARDAVACNALFARLIARHPFYACLFASDPEGNIFAASPSMTGNLNAGKQTYFMRALELGKAASGAPQICRISGKHVIAMAYPVIAQDGKMAAMAMLSLDIAAFGGWFEGLNPGTGVSVSVIDGQGTVLLAGPGEALAVGSRVPELGDKVAPPGWPLGVSGESDRNGGGDFYAYAPVYLDGANSVFVRVVMSQPAILARGGDFLWRLAILCAVILAISLAATYLAADRFVFGPVSDLRLATSRLAAGDLSARVPGRPLPGELADLGRDINAMALALERLLAEHGKAWDETRESGRRLRIMADALPVFIAQVDRERRYVFVNKHYEVIFQRKPEEVIGKHVWEILGQPGYDLVRDKIDRVLAGEQVQYEYVLPMAGGGRTMQSQLIPNLVENGEVESYFVLAQDVTERRQSIEDLRRAREQALEASRAKSDFLAKMSHEIRTPMNAVMGMTDLALHLAQDPLQRDYLKTALDSAHSLLGLINDILDLSKIEAAKVTLTAEDFDLGELLAQVGKSFSIQAGAKALSLTCQADPGMARVVRGDPMRLRQILTNLMGNAIKFTDKGGVSVTVGRIPDGPPHLARIEVRDSGIGIPPDHIEMIFDPFAQAQSSSRLAEGTGLGLAIVKRLAELMGGHVRVESIPGQGSVFICDVVLPDGDPDKLAVALRPDFTCVGRELRVLAVDDNAVNIKVVRGLLARLGHACITAASGEEAIGVLRRERCDMVLMDLEMPGMGGLEAARRIRAGAAGDEARNINIVAMTAHVVAGYRERSQEAGMNGFLPKPVDLAQLAGLLGFATPQAAAGEKSRQTGQERSGRKEALLRLGGDEALLAELDVMFFSTLEERIHALRAALGAGDYSALRTGAHGLKGTSAAIGENACSDLAQRVVTLIDTGEGGSPGPAVDALVAEIERLIARGPVKV